MAAPTALAVLECINRFLNTRRYQEALALIKGLRNGAVYGAKVRAPHALVMTFLFGTGSFRQQIMSILRATYTHSKNLGIYVFLYKSMLAIMRWSEGKVHHLHPLIAGFIGGYLIFGTNNKVNSQINMYVLSRILFGFGRLAVKKGVISEPKRDPFPIAAAFIWAIVMWQFENHQKVLQPSLQNSMTYLYHDSNIWHSLKDFIWHNKL
ncbi:peroxisomal membrane protein 4-like [Acanthaster planci]|uniref:Peroxisomal membrane protein 4-like n=1 Tax=Acanthaster planci TaxID=133434 RepID=A0A8B8A697_ACAPL|nr:peroxisomal membrane protein 4-like [Acanthaster planci]